MLIEISPADFNGSNSISYINGIIENAAESTTISFKKGDYHFHEKDALHFDYPLSNTTTTKTRNLALLIKNKTRLTLDFNEANLICHGQLQPITIDSSCEITVKNLVIDWEIPLSAEGVCIGNGEGYSDFKIDQKLFPHNVKDNTLFFTGENWEFKLGEWGHTYFDGITGLVPVGSGDAFAQTSVKMLEDGTVRFFAEHKVPKGSIAVLRHNERIHAAIFTIDSKNCLYENVTIHASGGLGLLCQFNENLSFNNVHFKPNYAKGRKCISAHDDGIHLVNNKGLVTVENCSFLGLMDDAINIHGISVRVIKIVDKKTLVCRFMHGQSVGFNQWAQAGEQLGFIENESMATYHKAIVHSFTLNSKTEFTLEFETEIPNSIKINDALENLTKTTDFVCKNNYFGAGRARGVLISTGGAVLVENNTFENAGCAILVAGDSNQWFESGACHDITIRHNTFTSACLCAMYQFCEGIISICPEIPKPDINKPYHSNITIENNVFNPFDYPVLYAFSTDNLKFNHNIIRRSADNKPWHPRQHMINLNRCQNVEIAKNHLIGAVLGKDIYYEETDLTVPLEF